MRDAYKASHSTVAFSRQRLITPTNSALFRPLTHTHCCFVRLQIAIYLNHLHHNVLETHHIHMLRLC